MTLSINAVGFLEDTLDAEPITTLDRPSRGPFVPHIRAPAHPHSSTGRKVMDDRSQAVRRNIERRKRDRQLEPPRAGAAGIDVEYVVDCVDLRHVRMAGDDDVYAALNGVDS